MSAISKEGYEQIKVIKAALDSMYDKLNQTVYTNDNGKYVETSVFDSVKDEFEAIAGIVALADEWVEV